MDVSFLSFFGIQINARETSHKRHRNTQSTNHSHTKYLKNNTTKNNNRKKCWKYKKYKISLEFYFIIFIFHSFLWCCFLFKKNSLWLHTDLFSGKYKMLSKNINKNKPTYIPCSYNQCCIYLCLANTPHLSSAI